MADEQQLKLFLSGDVMTGRGIDQILPFPGSAELHERAICGRCHRICKAGRARKRADSEISRSWLYLG
jgi:hypothetical protein